MYSFAQMRVAELDGIRGLAILLVLVTHFCLFQPQGRLEQAVRAALGMGWSGVDLFFVLSGFLITGILLRTRHLPTYFRTFYLRRSLRIFPLYYAALAVFFVVVPAIPLARGVFQGAQAGDAFWYFSYLSNWWLANHSGHELAHFWSLAIEEQFYLLWPAVVFLVPARKMPVVCVGFALGSYVARNVAAAWGLTDFALYMPTIFRMEGLAVGSLIACAPDRAMLVRLSRPVLFISGTFMIVLVATQGGWALSPVMLQVAPLVLALFFGACLVNSVPPFCNDPQCWQRRLLRLTFLADIGKYSYGLYVIHFPVACLLTPKLMALWRDMPSEINLLLPAVELLIGGAISYVIARVSWAVLEGPMLRVKERFEYARLAPASGAPGTSY